MKKFKGLTLIIVYSDVPGPVLDLKPVVVARKLIILNWSDPDDDGGSDLTGFVVERREPKMHTWRQPIETPASKCEIVGIIEGQEYIFRVVAKNKYGCGTPVDLGPIRAVDPQGNVIFTLIKCNCLNKKTMIIKCTFI